jgi:hypothetical protein
MLHKTTVGKILVVAFETFLEDVDRLRLFLAQLLSYCQNFDAVVVPAPFIEETPSLYAQADRFERIFLHILGKVLDQLVGNVRSVIDQTLKTLQQLHAFMFYGQHSNENFQFAEFDSKKARPFLEEHLKRFGCCLGFGQGQYLRCSRNRRGHCQART